MRMTLQTNAVLDELRQLGHASNATLLSRIRVQYPELSATTVHRITKRLTQGGVIGVTRSPLDGATLLDANPEPHYHFACQPCGKVQDIQLAPETVNSLENAIGVPIKHDALVITGIKLGCPHYNPNR